MDSPEKIPAIVKAQKNDITSKTAEQREQLKNFVVRHCMGDLKFECDNYQHERGLVPRYRNRAICSLDRKSIDSLLIKIVILSQTCASKIFREIKKYFYKKCLS